MYLQTTSYFKVPHYPKLNKSMLEGKRAWETLLNVQCMNLRHRYLQAYVFHFWTKATAFSILNTKNMVLNHKNGGHFVQHICSRACLLTTPCLFTSRLMKMKKKNKNKTKKKSKKQQSSEKGSLTLFWPMHHEVTNKIPWITAKVLVSSIKTRDFKFHLHIQVQSSDVIFIPSCFQLNKTSKSTWEKVALQVFQQHLSVQGVRDFTTKSAFH